MCLCSKREEWKARPDHVHPLLAPGDIVPTIVSGGTWMVTIPASCAVTADITYLPHHVDAEGTGKAVEAEVVDRLTKAVAGDPWLEEHPLQFTWSDDVVPAEMPADHPLVQTALGCAAALGHRGKPAGLNSWHDAATFTRNGTPTFSFGPDGIDTAHAVNERVSVGAPSVPSPKRSVAKPLFCISTTKFNALRELLNRSRAGVHLLPFCRSVMKGSALRGSWIRTPAAGATGCLCACASS